jgi:lipopolysaccharide/colanic/teichoic acid biosynthesis glycosyltransferase
MELVETPRNGAPRSGSLPRRPAAQAQNGRARARGGLKAPASATFRTLVRSEQACADRHGHPFCVITYESLARDRDEDLSAVIRIATSRLRATDWVGRIGATKVGILLPFAGREQGLRVANHIREGIESRAERVFQSIYCHRPAPERRFDRNSASVSPEVGARDPGPAPTVRCDGCGVPALICTEIPRWKRTVDVLVASLGLVVLSPLMLLIALLIKLSSEGPVIYKQWRTGKNLQRFQIYKFRTMRTDPDGSWESVKHLNEMTGPLFKSARDPRILGFGKLLRRTSLDELPQLVNVLKGEMTLIGPRALSPEPSAYETWQLRRFDVTPGLACSWQASRRSETDFDEWMRSDLRYIDEQMNLEDDLRLMGGILVTVLRCSGS